MLGKNFNQLTRFGLSYDMTFLAILISALEEEKPVLKQEICIAHPLSRRGVIRNDAGIRYSADISVILTYYKLKDDWEDEKSVKSFARVVYLRAVKKAIRQNPRQGEAIQAGLKRLHTLEKQHCNNPDEVADCFGKMLEVIFNRCDNNPALAYLGYQIGRLIYLTDAYCDFEKDIKNNSYNPFVARYGNKTKKESFGEDLKRTLTYTLSEIASAYELLDIKKNKELLDNIIYLGLRKNAEAL